MTLEVFDAAGELVPAFEASLLAKTAGLSFEAFLGQEYLLAGDTFQVNVSRAWSGVSPFFSRSFTSSAAV